MWRVLSNTLKSRRLASLSAGQGGSAHQGLCGSGEAGKISEEKLLTSVKKSRPLQVPKLLNSGELPGRTWEGFAQELREEAEEK
jgi:hypothetical protein